MTLKRIMAIAALALAILYAGDYLLLRYRMRKGIDPYGTVQVENYSAVPEKNNREEFFYDEPETEECVHALFPHFSDTPCWYATRNKIIRTDL